MPPTSVHAFIFDGQHPALADDPIFGPPCTSRVIQGLERLGIVRPTRIIRGKILPEQLAYDTTAFALGKSTESPLAHVRSNDKNDAKADGDLIHYSWVSVDPTTGQSDTFSLSPDQDRFRLVVADLAETLSAAPSTAGTYKLLTCIGCGLPWAVSVTGLSISEALAVNEELRTFTPYIGMALLDLGNPTHRDIMIEQMLHDDLILDDIGIVKKIKSNLSEEDRREEEVVAGWMGSVGQIRLLEPDDFNDLLPSLDHPEHNSERGELSRLRIVGRFQPDHRGRLLHALLAAYEVSPPASRVEFSTALEAGAAKYEFASDKFTSYLLNPLHATGGGKAKAFREVLGIKPSDWRFLADQIERSMDSAPLYRIKNGKWGINYGALVLVEGRNGQRMVLETGWMIESGKPARFITAYPGPTELGASLKTVAPFVVDPTLEGDARSDMIYKRALSEARVRASSVHPTPTTLENIINWEGEIGSAEVVIKGNDCLFSNWLLRQGLATGTAVTCVVPASAHRSRARNQAFAEAMAEVLGANGIEAEFRALWEEQ